MIYMARRITIIAVVLSAPLSIVAAAIYEITTGKSRPTLYLLLIAIPGALLAGLKEFKEFLPPARLEFDVNADEGSITKWQQGILAGNATRQVTDVLLPIRVKNADTNKAIDILDVAIISKDAALNLQIPAMQEVNIGSERQWVYLFNKAGYPELFNDGKQKTIEATRIRDFWVGVCEYETTHDEYTVQITFRDNWKRPYSKDVTIRRLE